MRLFSSVLVGFLALATMTIGFANYARVPCFATTTFSAEQKHTITLHKYDNYHVLYGCKPGPQPCSITIGHKKENENNSIRAGGYISPLYGLAKYFKVEDQNKQPVCEIKAMLELKEGECTLQYEAVKNPEKCDCQMSKEKGSAGDPGKPELDLMGNCLIKP